MIALGREVKGALLIIDDALGRRIAKLNGLKITGTAGVLLRAKNKGILAEVKPILERMRESGFFLSDRLMSEILEMAGER